MERAVFFDRDGVINKLVNRDGGLYSPRKFSEFEINLSVINVVNKLKQMGYLCIVVSNQPDISRGMMKQQELKSMTKFMQGKFSFNDIIYCIHEDSDNCKCRKPLPGMFYIAKDKWDIDLSLSYMVGDTWKDVEAARKANLKLLLLQKEYNKHIKTETRIDDINEVIQYVYKNDLRRAEK